MTLEVGQESMILMVPLLLYILVLLHLLDENCLLLEAKKTMCLHHGYYYY